MTPIPFGHFAIVFPIGPKNTNIVEDVEILVAVKFCSMPFSGFRGKVENISENQRPGGHLVFPISSKNTNLIKDVACILSSFVEFRSKENSKMWKINDVRTTDNA